MNAVPKSLRRLFLRWFPQYRILDTQFLSWHEADELMRQNEGKPESERWIVSKLEDNNHFIGYVYLERRERIWE
jgi:hypothetical protein